MAAAAGGRAPARSAEAKVETRKVFNAERKALQVMGLGSDATLDDVKAKYKALVKQHHPDANGGDRSTEDRLIEIIKAYNYLKTVVRGAIELRQAPSFQGRAESASPKTFTADVGYAIVAIFNAHACPFRARSRRRHGGGGWSRPPAR